tara:strand:+ start:668 stop:1363 length:696 start_codon:yes stop_codon:yes gene_type:complete
MKIEFDINVPTSQDNIPLHKYQKYVKLIEDNEEELSEEFLYVKLLQIFCGMELLEAHKIPMNQLDFIINHLIQVISSESKLQRRFLMTDPNGVEVEFGFMPNMSEMTLGEYIDLEKYISNWADMHKALAVMYRPIVAGKGEFYEIEEYEGSKKYSEVMKDAPMSVATGSIVFFYNLGKGLCKTILESTSQEIRQELQLQNNLLEKNGDGTNPSMHSLKEMSLNLKRLLNLI